MRLQSPFPPVAAQARDESPLPHGTGILLTGAVSLLMWAVIAGVAAII